MAAFMLESLVLRGSVLRDELAVGLRLGTGAKANPQAPMVSKSPNPAPVWRTPNGQPGVGPEVDYPTSGVTPGAGRSRRQLGSRVLPGTARTTRWSSTRCWPTRGGSTSAIAANCWAISAGFVALASEETSCSLAVKQSKHLRDEVIHSRRMFTSDRISVREKQGR